jgi:hypothetical protein
MNDPMKNYNELQQAIANQSIVDPDFRAELVADPKATLEKYLQQPFPVNVNVEVHEIDYDSIHLVVPKLRTARELAQLTSTSLEDMELSDEQLEAVAGGESVVVVGTILVASGVIVTSIVNSNDQTRQRFGW